jgi:hypothetical protein
MNGLAGALRDFVFVFDRLDVPYAVMGGLAARVHGIPRPTHDVDFTIAVSRERLPEIYRALSEIGYTIPEQYESGWVDQVAGMPLVKARMYLEGHGIDIDIFLAESAFQEELLQRRQREQMYDLSVWIVTPEDLILLKLISHRPRDLIDIGDVLFTQGELDKAYLRHWAERLGTLEELERVLTREG